jgi:hypothetical protein
LLISLHLISGDIFQEEKYEEAEKWMKTKMKKEEVGKMRENISQNNKINSEWVKVKAKRVRE